MVFGHCCRRYNVIEIDGYEKQSVDQRKGTAGQAALLYDRTDGLQEPQHAKDNKNICPNDVSLGSGWFFGDTQAFHAYVGLR